jgi:hypothetical protein
MMEANTAELSRSGLGLLLKKGSSAGIGVIAAVLTVLAIDQWRVRAVVEPTAGMEDARRAVANPSGEKVVHSIVVDGHAFDRIAELERKLRELEQARAAGAAASAAPEMRPPDPVEMRRQVDAMYAELDRNHERDASDPEWALEASQALVGDLTTLGEKLGFTVGPTDCKTTTCRSTITFGSYADAQANGARLAEEYFGGLNCVQRVRQSRSQDPNGPSTAHLYLDCTDLRAGVVQPMKAD